MNSHYYPLEEKARLRALVNYKVGIAIMSWLAALWLYANEPLMSSRFAFPILIAQCFMTGIYIWGLMDYARSKGYSLYWALVGFLPLVGLFILIVLPDRWGEQPEPKMKVSKASW